MLHRINNRNLRLLQGRQGGEGRKMSTQSSPFFDRAVRQMPPSQNGGRRFNEMFICNFYTGFCTRPVNKPRRTYIRLSSKFCLGNDRYSYPTFILIDSDLVVRRKREICSSPDGRYCLGKMETSLNTTGKFFFVSQLFSSWIMIFVS